MKNKVVSVGLILNFVMSIGQAQTFQFNSPNGKTEYCQILTHLPEAQYSAKDTEIENELCQINFYDSNIFLCGKNWSTSPSTLILKKNSLYVSTDKSCINKKSIDTFKKSGKFKVSMNESGTSGTFSSSSLLYYHLSRYLNTSFIVPVAVSRQMDADSHFQLVTSQVKNFENKMVQAAWDYLYRAENGNPQAVQPVNEIFTSDYSKIFGALIDTVGNEKYGEHLRGSKQSQWGLQQHLEMKKTPVFRALFNSKEFYSSQDEAAQFGVVQYKNDFGNLRPTAQQMMSWMQDLSDMSVLDFIMQQQDRPGNIHFQWRIFYTESGKLKSDRIKVVNNGSEEGLEKKYKLPKDLDKVRALALQLPKYTKLCSGQNPCFVIQKTVLEDNDAGGRIYYKDFYKQAGILESLRHMNKTTYLQLLKLDQSLMSQDQTFNQLKTQFKLDTGQLNQLVRNVHQAAQIVNKSYQLGILQLDLDSSSYFLTGKVISSKN